MKITIDDRIRFDKTLISREVFREIRDTFSHKNPEYYKKQGMGYGVKDLTPMITTYKVKGKEMSLPRGGIRKFLKILKEKKIKYEIVDKRFEKPFKEPLKFNLVVDGQTLEPDKYQKQQILNSVVKQQGMLVTPTSGGKTVITSLIVDEVQQYTLFLMHTSKLAKQWIDFLSESFNLPKEEIGYIGGGKFNIKPLTVGLVQSVNKKINQLKYEFGCIVMDECHHASAPSFLKSVDPFPAKYRFGCTGTPYRKDQKQFLMYDVFGDIVFEITDENLKEVDRIMDVKIKVIKTEFEYREFETIDGEQVELIVHPTVMSDKLISNKERNSLIYSYLRHEIDNNKFCIMLTDRRPHAVGFKRWLRHKGINAKLFVGGKKYEKEGEDAINEMNDGKLNCLIGINQGTAEGISIRRLDRGFLITPSAGNKAKIIQQHGRLKRKHPDKTDAILYYFWDYKIYPSHLKNIQKYFGKENVDIIN